jgi:hypothetical protein
MASHALRASPTGLNHDLDLHLRPTLNPPVALSSRTTTSSHQLDARASQTTARATATIDTGHDAHTPVVPAMAVAFTK